MARLLLQALLVNPNLEPVKMNPEKPTTKIEYFRRLFGQPELTDEEVVKKAFDMFCKDCGFDRINIKDSGFED